MLAAAAVADSQARRRLTRMRMPGGSQFAGTARAGDRDSQACQQRDWRVAERTVAVAVAGENQTGRSGQLARVERGGDGEWSVVDGE